MYADVVDRVAGADDDLLLCRLKQLEEQRRALEAETALILAELDERKVYRHDQHATMWGLLRATLGWSDRECRRRMRIGRLVTAFTDAGEVLYDARASVANIAEIARGVRQPQVRRPRSSSSSARCSGRRAETSTTSCDVTWCAGSNSPTAPQPTTPPSEHTNVATPTSSTPWTQASSLRSGVSSTAWPTVRSSTSSCRPSGRPTGS